MRSVSLTNANSIFQYVPRIKMSKWMFSTLFKDAVLCRMITTFVIFKGLGESGRGLFQKVCSWGVGAEQNHENLSGQSVSQIRLQACSLIIFRFLPPFHLKTLLCGA